MRVYNFGAGPATLPTEIINQAQSDGFNWLGLGMSVMEVSHRSVEFISLLEETERLMRELLVISDDYKVLFIGAPARFHFATIPLNFLKTKADYIVSGAWSKMAAAEAEKQGNINVVASNVNSDHLKAPCNYSFDETADYCYYTPNETLSGLYLSKLDKRPKNVPLIADMTSCLLSEPLNISDYSMIFAGAQKNLAPAGLSVVIIKQCFLESIDSKCLPAFLDYRVHAKNNSNYATPPTFNIYMANLMLKWLKSQGGITSVYACNMKKAALLYEAIDMSTFYYCPIEKSERSMMNVTFRLVDESFNQQFLKEAKVERLVALKGHRSVGGMRASIYNSMPVEGIKQLVQFMKVFESKIGKQ